MLSLSSAALSFAPTTVPALQPRASVQMADGVAPDFSDKPWTSAEVSDKAGLIVRAHPRARSAYASRRAQPNG